MSRAELGLAPRHVQLRLHAHARAGPSAVAATRISALRLTLAMDLAAVHAVGRPVLIVIDVLERASPAYSTLTGPSLTCMLPR